MVSQIVAMGSALDQPFDISIPTRLAVAGVRQLLTGVLRRAPEGGCLTTACRCPFAHDFAAPFPASVPLTSIYSKGDGVVWWEACIVPYARPSRFVAATRGWPSTATPTASSVTSSSTKGAAGGSRSLR